MDREGTHVSNFIGIFETYTDNPSDPEIGDIYFNTVTNALMRWTGNNWIGALFT